MSGFWRTDLHRKVGFCDDVYIHLAALLLTLLSVLTSNTSVQPAYMLPSAALRNKCGRIIPRATRNGADRAAVESKSLTVFSTKTLQGQSREGNTSRFFKLGDPTHKVGGLSFGFLYAC